ncbi:unnamed protein product [Eruca vesicaria subsp. sativa]|uniref:UBZ4-type domain-containing protein n=1 Tax=Eruca vesicaria subsp. sativa TaxID=29727 RepID=A0ABC8L8M0_ERUVS|nr:unnamed protein product [Eruca vesicaria subsp. sativa]
MFLSTENPPHDPLTSPSPSSLLHLITTSSDELGQSHLQNFSIRDYAYSNRKNNIKNSWPFSPNSLQLCSTHGVTDPLPPFQKYSNVSNKFKTTASSSSGKRDLSKLGVNQTLAETRKGVCSQSRIFTENGFGTSTSVSKSKVEIVVAGTSSNNKNNKKCGRVGMVKSKEDTCGGGGLVMTTTTCPICKTFSSASNTTLNAHIDQCLSADSELPPVSTYKPNKPRVDQCLSVTPPVSTKPNKPRAKPLMKVKTMVDIYASAKPCTLEDLDKRNGTTWASVLSHTNQAVAGKSEVSKKRKVPPVGVGPVYIDAKGQKLRILTEFSEKKTSTTNTTTPLREQHEDGSKESSKSLRKRSGGKKHYKYLKLTKLKANTSEIHECQRGFSGEGSSTGHRRIYNQRMLSKRGVISKKLSEKGHKLYTLRDQPSEDDDDEDSWSGEERLVLRGTDSSPLNKQKELSGRNKTMFGSKGAQSRSFRDQMSQKEEKSLTRTHLDSVQFKKRLASIQEDKYPLEKNVREVATSMRKLSAPLVSNGWRQQSLPLELKKARLDMSEEDEDEEEEGGKWESEMTQERELSEDDYVSGDDNSPSFSRYDDDDDDEESSKEEEEEDDSNNSRANDATPSTNETILSERATYYSEEVGDMIYGQTTCDEDVRFGSEVRGKGSLFVEVDTIPIPGPPGSFLPSPRDMCYDENLGNSSVITSQIQSFDRNSSESPVSNFAAGRLSFPVELSSSYTTTPVSFYVPSHHETITEAETSTVDKTEPPPRLRNNDDQSCFCCQRKERISEGIALNHHQTSHLLQRRTAAYSSTKPPPTRLDPNHPFEQLPYMAQQDLDLQSKFSNRAVVVPPSPNPVLRLMGKDLMVMNQVEASKDSFKPPTQFLDPPPCAGTGLYLNTGLYLRNSFESTDQPQTQTQASSIRNNF